MSDNIRDAIIKIEAVLSSSKPEVVHQANGYYISFDDPMLIPSLTQVLTTLVSPLQKRIEDYKQFLEECELTEQFEAWLRDMSQTIEEAGDEI